MNSMRMIRARIFTFTQTSQLNNTNRSHIPSSLKKTTWFQLMCSDNRGSLRMVHSLSKKEGGAPVSPLRLPPRVPPPPPPPAAPAAPTAPPAVADVPAPGGRTRSKSSCLVCLPHSKNNDNDNSSSSA